MYARHIQVTIANVLIDILNQWKIPLEKVHVVLRDNTANMKKAMETLGVCSLVCFAHASQLVGNERQLSQ